MKYVSHIKTPNSYIIMFDEGRPVTVYKDKHDKAYQQVSQALSNLEYDKISEIASLGTFIQKKGGDKIKVENGFVVMDKETLPESLSKRLIAMFKAKADISALVNFWRKLKNNPSKQSVTELYGFLEHNHVPITPEGDFIAYKSVCADYMDRHSRTFNNTPGQIVEMPREDVNPNRNETCSHGLHVAAFQYAKFIYSGQVLLDVLVDPADVVSVPVDYNQQKMRVCRYKVLCVHGSKEEIKEQVASRKVKPVAKMKTNEIGCTKEGKYIRVTKSMLSLIPKPKDGDITPLYVCVQKKGCIAILRKPYSKPIYCKKYDTTSSVNITADALAAAEMSEVQRFEITKAKDGIFFKKAWHR